MKRYANLQALCERHLQQERANGQCVPHHSAVYTSSFVHKTRCTNYTVYARADEPKACVPKKGTWKDFLGTRHLLQSQFYFFCPTSVSTLLRICVCVYICVYTHTYTHTHSSQCRDAGWAKEIKLGLQ